VEYNIRQKLTQTTHQNLTHRYTPIMFNINWPKYTVIYRTEQWHELTQITPVHRTQRCRWLTLDSDQRILSVMHDDYLSRIALNASFQTTNSTNKHTCLHWSLGMWRFRIRIRRNPTLLPKSKIRRILKIRSCRIWNFCFGLTLQLLWMLQQKLHLMSSPSLHLLRETRCL